MSTKEKLSDLLAKREPRSRSKYPDQLKARVCTEFARGDSLRELGERHGVNQNLISSWVKKAREGAFDSV